MPEMARCAENGMELRTNLRSHAPEGQTVCARDHSLVRVALLRGASIRFSLLSRFKDIQADISQEGGA